MMHAAAISSFASAFLNHLWQSTVFTAAAALFVMLLRGNAARVRYWLWLSASIKFLVPLQLLTSLGARLPLPSVGISGIAAYTAFDVAGKPVTAQALPLSAALCVVLLSVWLCGVLFVFTIWRIKGRLIAQALRQGQPMQTGREVLILEQMSPTPATPVTILLMPSGIRIEPGIAGLWRPRLLWPAGLSARLSDEQMTAILAHELEHVRRHDNLTAMLHMFVEALFWFHPLVWWLERKLIEERERACDEAVLQAGGQPGVYAQSLLEACRFCIEPPLTCVSGLGGAQLRARVVRILRGCAWQQMDWNRRLLLLGAATIAIAMPLLFGQMSTALTLPMPVAPAPPPPPPPPPGSMAWARIQQEAAAHKEMQALNSTQLSAHPATERTALH